MHALLTFEMEKRGYLGKEISSRSVNNVWNPHEQKYIKSYMDSIKRKAMS